MNKLIWLASLVFAGSIAGPAAAQSPDTMTVHEINVGQGAATLLEFSCAAALIDTGGQTAAGFRTNDKLLAYLNAFFARRSDLNRTFAVVYLSHPHPDHYAGVSPLLKAANGFHISNVVDNSQKRLIISPQVRLRRSVRKEHYQGIKNSDLVGVTGFTNAIIDPIDCGAVDPELRVLWGKTMRRPRSWKLGEYHNENNHSVLLRVDFGASSLLFAGDLEEAGERDVVTRYQGTNMLDVDVFHAPHHGASNGSGDPLLELIKPRIVLLGVGAPTPTNGFSAFTFGHPRADTMARCVTHVLDDRPAPKAIRVATGKRIFVAQNLVKAIYGTGWDGNIRIEARIDGTYRVSTEQ